MRAAVACLVICGCGAVLAAGQGDGEGYPDTYVIDSGTGDSSFGSGGWMGWLNQFTIAHGQDTITAIRIAFGIIESGIPVKAYLWSDPNQDGNPSDAQVLSSGSGFTAFGNTDEFVTFDIPDKFVGRGGTHFFVGAIIEAPGARFPARIDQGWPARQSWYIAGGDVYVDPHSLGASEIVSLMDDFGPGFAGNWLVRANSIPQPGPCCWLLLLAAAARRRQLR